MSRVNEHYILKVSDIPKLVRYFMERNYVVIAPIKDEFSKVRLCEIKSLDDVNLISLDYTSTILPPKKYLLPPIETVLKISFKDNYIEIHEVKSEKRLVFLGIHPCDLEAIKVLDKVMLEDEYKDTYYEARRKQLVIIVVNCLNPDEYCFCLTMNTGPIAKNGYDLALTKISDDKYIVQAKSNIGLDIVKHLGLNTASSEDIEKFNEIIHNVELNFKKKLKLPQNLPEILIKQFDHEYWSKLAEKCLSCGTCTTVCPTCFCYTMIDNLSISGKDIERIRYWDSCLFPEFAEVALGLRFRAQREARLKHRMYHKLAYIMSKYGLPGCVGCGRCVRYCVKHIDPYEVLEVLTKVN